MYLAKKAGYRTYLVDKDENVPAAGLCLRFFQTDVFEEKKMLWLMANVDLVIPATENVVVLEALTRYQALTGTPMPFDLKAYYLSSSKKASDQFFMSKGIPAPKPYPECAYPVIVKPRGKSGSKGVRKVASPGALNAHPEYLTDAYVVQEYLEGRSFSIEVIGWGKQFNLLQITEILVDGHYDCKQVVAPAAISAEQAAAFHEIAAKLAGAIQIHGIFDIEVIADKGRLKVLEIDARIPSQTPISVYHSTGVNMLTLMEEAAVGHVRPVTLKASRVCLFQQIRFTEGRIEMLGEGIMAEAGPLSYYKNFFGADEALTNFAPGKDSWVATLIVTAETEISARNKLSWVFDNMMEMETDTPVKEAVL